LTLVAADAGSWETFKVPVRYCHGIDHLIGQTAQAGTQNHRHLWLKSGTPLPYYF
tara:strand:+ start:165 stop:329 length:165 start_codon:yes stop_codon:yes gene_type:complete